MNALFGFIGKKLGMSQVFNPSGKLIGVTAVEVGPCVVVQKRTIEKDGYSALQIGFCDKPERKANRPEMGHFSKSGVSPKRVLKEFRVDPEVADQFQPGQVIDLNAIGIGDKLDITSVSKGRGFQGVMKRYGFSGAKDTHGVHEFFRHGGSLGMNMTPGHVVKGKKMPGHQGDVRVTVQNVEVMRVFAADNIIFLKGPIPGSPSTILTLNPRIKKR